MLGICTELVHVRKFKLMLTIETLLDSVYCYFILCKIHKCLLILNLRTILRISNLK